jgi:hypothetical protein
MEMFRRRRGGEAAATVPVGYRQDRPKDEAAVLTLHKRQFAKEGQRPAASPLAGRHLLEAEKQSGPRLKRVKSDVYRTKYHEPQQSPLILTEIMIAGNDFLGTWNQQSYRTCALLTANRPTSSCVGFGPAPFHVKMDHRGAAVSAVNKAAGQGQPVTPDDRSCP